MGTTPKTYPTRSQRIKKSKSVTYILCLITNHHYQSNSPATISHIPETTVLPSIDVDLTTIVLFESRNPSSSIYIREPYWFSAKLQTHLTVLPIAFV